MNPEGAAPRIVVAGGAAAAPYYEKTVKASDADFFAVGLTTEELPELASDFILAFCRSHERLADSLSNDLGVLTLSESALTIALQVHSRCQQRSGRHSVVRKYQLFTKAYSSGSAAVHSFDVPSSCTFYDGRTAWSTTLGAYAHLFRVNLVNPLYRTSTFEPRLIKYFNRRYYALGLVDLATKALQTKIEIRHFVITPRRVCGNWAVGDVQDGYEDTCWQTVSDAWRLGTSAAEAALCVAEMVFSSLKNFNELSMEIASKRFKKPPTPTGRNAAATLIDWWVKNLPGKRYAVYCPYKPATWYHGYALAAEPGKASADVLEQSMLAAETNEPADGLALDADCCCEGFDQGYDYHPPASLLLLE